MLTPGKGVGVGIGLGVSVGRGVCVCEGKGVNVGSKGVEVSFLLMEDPGNEHEAHNRQKQRRLMENLIRGHLFMPGTITEEEGSVK